MSAKNYRLPTSRWRPGRKSRRLVDNFLLAAGPGRRPGLLPVNFLPAAATGQSGGAFARKLPTCRLAVCTFPTRGAANKENHPQHKIPGWAARDLARLSPVGGEQTYIWEVL